MAKMTLEKFMRQGNNGVLSKDYNTDVQGADVQSPVNDPGFLEYLRSKAGNLEASLGGAMRFAGQIADTVAPNADGSDGFLTPAEIESIIFSIPKIPQVTANFSESNSSSLGFTL